MNKLLVLLTLPLTLLCLAPAQAQTADNAIQLPNGDLLSTLSILPNGDFTAGLDGWSAGGYIGDRPDGKGSWKNSFEVREDKGATFIRIICLDADGKDFAISTSEDIPLPSDPAFRSLLFTYRYRVAQLKLGELNYHTLRFGLTWHNPDGASLGDEVFEVRKNIPVWTDQEKTLRIPVGATFARLRIHFLGANGIIDVTDLKLQPLSTQRK